MEVKKCLKKSFERFSTDQLFNFFREQSLQVLNLNENDFSLLRKRRITGASFLCYTKEDLSQTGLEWDPRLEIYNLTKRVNEVISKMNKHTENDEEIKNEPKKKCVVPGSDHSDNSKETISKSHVVIELKVISMLGLKSGRRKKNVIESVATKHRNNCVGPRKCPDNFWFIKSKSSIKLQYEFLYLEVSGGPFISYTKVKEHIKEDQKRLAKSCKDS
ncbi:hypothetical protein C1645_741628 [Glomus cerebriforme]|uniref:SAM domain-containing protein n=1 Tax=Glomus cerebriforme TaxID=658196 RepID=A0A397SR88_9GLOM|nr:hypothetical protein C1645_741628 [Glomus cerebriforme]